MTKILAFDVSNNCTSVAISNGDEILAFEEALQPNMQAEKLVPMIESLLRRAGIKYSDLQYVSTLVGPGSFTGIRIGLACAKAVSLASGIGQVPITNFEILHYRVKEQIKEYKNIIIAIDAYRNQIYLQQFSINNDISDPKILDIDDAVSLIKQAGDKAIIAGSAIIHLYDLIKDLDIKILPRFPRVRSIHICRLAYEKIIQGKCGVFEPLYIRPPDAIKPS